MKWQGNKIKQLAGDNNLSLSKLSEMVKVSRQTVNGWISGKMPKGNHLIKLCNTLNVSPDYFFSETDHTITVPVHRTRRKAKVTQKTQKDAFNLAKEYSHLFRNDHHSGIYPVVRTETTDIECAKKIARTLRDMAEVSKDSPLGYQHIFLLMKKLGIKVIFRYFPETIKAYAFYTKICGHRVTFVNNHTNTLDLIFPLIHEAVHAIRDEIQINEMFDQNEEQFCDDVANYVQFPDAYIKMIYDAIRCLSDPGHKIKILKTFAQNNGHSLYGVIKRIQTIDSEFNLKIGGADTNLKKQFKTIGERLFENSEAQTFLKKIKEWSPLFVDTVIQQSNDISTRKLGELFGLQGYLDADTLKKEIMLIRSGDIHVYTL
jgi:transcriptional regulator with XRE-family HTH domain